MYIASSKLANSVAPDFLQISPASPVWSECPCVSATCVTPLVASSQAIPDCSKVGLPLRKGSMRITLVPVSSRKQECPYQIIFTPRLLAIAPLRAAQYKDRVRDNNTK